MKPSFCTFVAKRESALQFTDDLLKRARLAAHMIDDQREEILTAFVAKFGFQPEECEQVVEYTEKGQTWCIIHLDPDKVARVTRAIIVSRLGGHLNFWQRLCLRLAGL